MDQNSGIDNSSSELCDSYDSEAAEMFHSNDSSKKKASKEKQVDEKATKEIKK
jgi:hypothetical protein